MIDIQYNHPNIRVETKQVSMLYNLPLTLNIKSHVSKETTWSCQLENYSWATFSNDSIFDIEIKDSKGKIVINKEFNVLEEGSYLDKALHLYCQSLNNHQGLAIGSHDGEFGEWISEERRVGIECRSRVAQNIDKSKSNYLLIPKTVIKS